MQEVSVPDEAIINGPSVNWQHIDGPLMTWAGHVHWLTWGERIALALRLTTVEKLACERWPFTGMRYSELTSK